MVAMSVTCYIYGVEMMDIEKLEITKLIKCIFSEILILKN